MGDRHGRESAYSSGMLMIVDLRRAMFRSVVLPFLMGGSALLGAVVVALVLYYILG